MKKSKLTLGLVTGILAAGVLAGCDVTKSNDGYILDYTTSSGETLHYSANDLFDSYLSESSSISTIFDNIYKLVVRNYFKVEPAGKDKYDDIVKSAQNDRDGVYSKAEENSKTNKTKYDDELETLLESYGCEDVDELLEHFIYERELKEFNEQFYKNNLDHLRDSKTTDTTGDKYEGYLEKKVPHHVRHILIKVDESSGTNYWNSNIGQGDAQDLADLGAALAEGEQTFGQIASEHGNDDTKETFGELGIMDKDTNYIDEFKLGTYAFDQLYNGSTATLAENSNVNVPDELISDFKKVIGGETSIPTIPYEAFVKLGEYAKVTSDENNSPVNDGSSTFYPRNVIFNKYFNKHSFAVVTPNSLNSGTISTDGTAVTGEDEVGTYNADYAAMGGFREVQGITVGDGTHNEILTTNTGKPILVFRGGSSAYQGVHFLVIERDGLVETADGVTLSQYYTTKYPGQEGYPVDGNKNPLKTYVTFLPQNTKEYKNRAEKVEDAIKNFDSANLSKYIYSKYVASEKVSIKDEKIKLAISKWISRAQEKSNYDEDIAYEKKWADYIETLSQQNVERKKLVSEACAIGYLNAAKGDAWNKIGGVCNDNKAK